MGFRHRRRQPRARPRFRVGENHRKQEHQHAHPRQVGQQPHGGDRLRNARPRVDLTGRVPVLRRSREQIYIYIIYI